MPIEPLPSPYVRVTAAAVDDESTFTASPNVTIGPVTWQVGTEVLAVEQLDDVATAAEQLLQQDFAGAVYLSKNVPAGGSQGAITVGIVLGAGGLPSTVSIGTWTGQSPGMAASFAALVRQQGIGSQWSPA